MNLAESLRIALRALAANKVRSVLTMLGVIIGVAAVILLVAIGTGVRAEITGSIEGLGSNLLFVLPGQLRSGGGGFGGANVTKRFRISDAEYLDGRLSGQATAVPVIQAPATLRVGNRTQSTRIAASTNEGNIVFNAEYALGRHYSLSEYTAAADVALLGSNVRDNLFPNQNPLGRSIDINGRPFRIVGVLAPRGGSLAGNEDNQVYIPATTAQQLLGISTISTIVVRADRPDEVRQVRSRINRLLKPRFGDQFTVFTQQQTLGVLSTLLGTLTLMLAGIAGISLLVGGIGIMNIMLVSVTERTREIGIRKAVGARTHDILSQFVIEAVLLSAAGGLVGIALGAAGAFAVSALVPTQVTWWSVAIAFFFAAGVGVFFGVYPAWRASRLDPIAALRYE